MKFRQERIEEEVAKNAANYFRQISSRESLINVTHVSVSPDLRNLIVMISIFPNEAEGKALQFCKRHEGNLRTYIAENMHIKFVPKVSIEIDKGEKNRQRIEELLNQ